MSRNLAWTDAQDTQIRRRRGEGANWEAIAADLALTLWAVTERGRRIGASRPPAEFVPAGEDPQREPLPAGHPTSWDAITAGTVLEGEAYPLPFFRR
ncbi:MAG TPA: AsnC family protein [Acetobacteraceae bacterium]|nr:AsnC family protein [Acetobacteraceae bacterium]